MVGLVHSFRGKKKRGPRAPAGEKNGKGLRHFSMRGQVFPPSTAELSNCKLNLDGSVSVWIICCCCFSVGFTHSHNRYYCKFGLSVTEQTPLLSVSWRVVNFIPDFFFDAGDFWFPNLSLVVGMCYSLSLQSVRRWRAKVGQLTMRHVFSLLLLLCLFLPCAASFIAD